MEVKKYLIKALKKLKLLRFINFSYKGVYRKTTYKIPFISGIGIENFFLQENWMDALIGLMNFQPFKTFIDVGVNTGQTLIKQKSQLPDISYIGFEPNAICCYYVSRLAEINNMGNISIFHTALYNQNGPLILEKGYDYDSRASVIHNQRPGMLHLKEQVWGIVYDDHFSDFEMGLIKIDVEGAEFEVLSGMMISITKYRPFIVCEILDSYSMDVFEFTQQRAAQIYNMLKDINYSVFKLKNSQTPEAISMDEIKIKLWQQDSLTENDYLFYPAEKKQLIVEYLSKYYTIDDNEQK